MSAPVAGRVWQAPNPEYQEVVEEAFQANKAMSLIGAALGAVEPGIVEIHLPVHDQLMAHIPGIVHGGTLGMIADSAMGFAALSLAEPGQTGVTVEYKITFLAPAMGDEVLARAEIVKPGKKVMAARADVTDLDGDKEKLVAIASATLIPL